MKELRTAVTSSKKKRKTMVAARFVAPRSVVDLKHPCVL